MSALPEARDLKRQVEYLRRQKHKTPDDLFRLRGLEATLKESGEELRATLEGMLLDAGTAELAVAITRAPRSFAI